MLTFLETSAPPPLRNLPEARTIHTHEGPNMLICTDPTLTKTPLPPKILIFVKTPSQKQMLTLNQFTIQLFMPDLPETQTSHALTENMTTSTVL
jgi:hypothetical protein